jgi:CzcA family heavy metal efflux pump
MKYFTVIKHQSSAMFFIVALLVIGGAALMLTMPVSLFPDITFPRLVVLADNGEEPAERMMIEVTQPLEEAASSIPGVTVMRSATGRGSTEISIGLAWGSDVQKTLQLLQGRIEGIRNQLPASASIRAEQMTVAVFPVLGYSLTSDSVDPVRLRDIALYQIRPAVLQVPGVARVEVDGGDTREFLVTVSPERLSARHLDIRKVSAAIRSANLVSSTGLMADDYRLYLSLVSGLLHTVQDIKSVVVDMQNGVPVRVEDIADVAPAAADRYIRTTARGRDAVLINILKQPTGSTVKIGREVDAVVRALTLQKGVRFENFYDQAAFINSSIVGTRDSIIIGIVLAMLVIILFLRSGGMTLVIALVVPATIAATFVCLSIAHLTINIMTLGGIAAAVGLIIDDAIVVIENVFSHLAHGRDPRHSFATLIGASLRELMPAVAGSTASTIVINVPLIFLGGVTGAFFTSLSITMICTLFISFVFSITLAPLLASFTLSQRDVAREVAREQRPSRMAAWYGNTMKGLLRRRLLAVPVAVLIVAITWFFYTRIGSGFMPDMDEGTFVLDYASPPGTSLDETDRMLRHVESILMDAPEVASYSRRTGTQLGFFLTEPNTGDFMVKLKERRTRGIDEVIADVRAKVESSEPSLRIEFGQLMMDVIGDLTNNPQPVEIKVFGDAAKLLSEKAAEIASRIEKVPGVVDVFDGIVISGPSAVVEVDRLKAGRAGLTVSDVWEQLSTMMRGSAETGVQFGKKVIPIRVRYPAEYRKGMINLDKVLFVNGAGTLVPLKDVCTIVRTGGMAEVHREGLRRMVSVTARIEGRDLGSTISDIKKVLSSRLVFPSGMTMEFGGVYKTQQESFRGLLLVALSALLLVSLVLLLEFNDFGVLLAVLSVDLLSLCGVFGALWLTGTTFNISSFVGVIMIIGIVAENAIFVMHKVSLLRGSGLTLDDALVKAAIQRARPILMTTLGAVFALLPLAIGIGSGAKMQQPLAIAVIGGFSVSSLLLFFALPLAYRIFSRPSLGSSGEIK